MTTLQVTPKRRHNFGKRTAYPVCATARLLADFANVLAFSERHITLLIRMGYTVEEVVVLPDGVVVSFEAYLKMRKELEVLRRRSVQL